MTKVAPANDAQGFLDSLATSQILPAETLAKIREKYESATEVKAVARELIKDGVLTKWQAQQLLGRFTALIVGNYKLLDQLGVGEMGRVYLAEHIQMQRKVALKVLARKHTSQPNVLRRLLAEARRVAAIEHPNISHIHDVNQDGERYFIVLEYVDADDLQRVIKRDGKLPATKAWNYIRQTAEGLAHAHGKGVVHGGLKPSNLLVDKLGNVKILDFGLAQLAGGLEGSNGDSVEQAAITSKLYRAPESEKQPATQQADVYALGASLYYFLTGKDPVDGPASSAKLVELAADTPASVVELCSKLMSADPAARPQDDKALIAVIDAAKPRAAAPPAPKPAAPKSVPPPPKPTSIPIAKALPDSSAAPAAGAPVAKEPPPRAKKPVMAKALPISSEPAIEVAAAAPSPAVVANETPAVASASDTPFAGFAIQTKKSKTPAAKATSGAMPAVGAAAPAPAAMEGAVAATPAKGSKSAQGKAAKTNMPLIIAGGVGGGVLVLTGIIALIMFLMSGKKDEKQLAKGEGEKTTASAGESTTTPTGEANPPEANPVVAEANPKPPPVDPNAVKPAPVQPEPVKPEPPKPEPAPAVQPMPVDPPMVAVVPPKPPEPKPMPNPAPVGDPFAGFAKNVALPKVPTGVTEAPPEMLVPVVLGPCKLGDENTIVTSFLKGGETAYSKGKMKFTLEAANGGTATRDWEFKVSGGLAEKPVIVALMSAKNDQLTFQWTPEAAKHPAAPYLCNCLVELKAGNGKSEFALRQPVSFDPIVIGIDKRPPPAKFNIDLPPEPKQLMFEIVAVEGEVPKVKYDNKELLADKDTTFFWVGNVETEMPLGIKVDTSLTNGNRTVQVVTMPHFKIEPRTRPTVYGKKELGVFKSEIDAALQTGAALINQAAAARDAKQKSDLNQQGTLLVEPAQKADAQFKQMLDLAKGLQTNGKLHFRIYATAEDGKVEIANSQGAAATPAPASPPPAAKGPANPPANPAANAAADPPMRQARPGAKPPAAVARPPIGVIEVTAEDLGKEALESEFEPFDTKYQGKQFRVSGTVEMLQETHVYLKVNANKNGEGINVIMIFAKAADVKGLQKGAEVIIDGDFQRRAVLGPAIHNCEIVSK